jgi:hypothetical protein
MPTEWACFSWPTFEVEVICIYLVTYRLFTTHVLARLGHPKHRSARSLPSRRPLTTNSVAMTSPLGQDAGTPGTQSKCGQRRWNDTFGVPGASPLKEAALITMPHSENTVRI